MPKRAANSKTNTAKAGDSAKRAARTGVQGAAAVTVIVQGINLFGPRPLTPEQVAWVTVAATMLVSFLMNLLEEAGMPALLKGAPPAPPADDPTRRELNAMAAAIGDLKLEMRALQALQDAQRQAEPERIFTGQAPANTWQPGGLG